jgi:hypothetical protein
MHETLSQEFKISYFNQLANGLKKVSNKISKQASPSVIISPTHSALTKLNKQQKGEQIRDKSVVFSAYVKYNT